jgi:hypothetical protein
VGWFEGWSGIGEGRGVTRSGDGYFGGEAEGWGGLGGEWDSGGEGRLLSLCFTLQAAFGWLSSFGRFAER